METQVWFLMFAVRLPRRKRTLGLLEGHFAKQVRGTRIARICSRTNFWCLNTFDHLDIPLAEWAARRNPTIHHQWISSLLDKCIFGNNSSNPILLMRNSPCPKMNKSNAKPDFPWVFNVATHLSAGKGTWTIHWNRLVFPCPSCRYINKATYDAVDQSGRILIKMCLGPI